MKIMNRTDLACEIISKQEISEGVTIEKLSLNQVAVTRIEVGENGAEKMGKPKGKYITLRCREGSEADEIEAISTEISKLVSDKGRVLVAGLGNENITPDSLGPKTVSRVLATAHFTKEKYFDELGMREVFVIETGVLAQTGIESSEQIMYLANGIKPDYIIVIDSLACSEFDRLSKTVQITDTGIAPGSGVKNKRKELSERMIGVPVIAIGVPTVIDLKSLIGTEEKEAMPGMVMLRDIDSTIIYYAKIISNALNKALNPTLTHDEINSLLL